MESAQRPPNPAGDPPPAPRRRPRIEQSAGGVVLRRIRGRVHVLLIRDPYANWGLPKGHVEPGETRRGAAVREVEEETGLRKLVPGPELPTIDWYFRIGNRSVHKFCSFFLMISPEGRTVPEAAEGITACRWVRLDEAVEEISYDNAREVILAAIGVLEDGADLPAPL